MVSIDTFHRMALSFEETRELPHFELTSFRVNKKIFATLDEKRNRAVLMLSVIDQSAFCVPGNPVMYPVPNKWGTKGATIAELSVVTEEMLWDALTTAYCKAAPKVLALKYQQK